MSCQHEKLDIASPSMCADFFIEEAKKTCNAMIGSALSADSLGLSPQLHAMPDVLKERPVTLKKWRTGDLGGVTGIPDRCKKYQGGESGFTRD